MTTSQHLEEAKALLTTCLQDESLLEAVDASVVEIWTAISSGGKVISCGNGGSMSDAMHFAEEMTACFRDKRQALPAIAISDPSHITCTANDYGFEQVFSRYVEALGQPQDVLLAISTSGNSANVLKAAETAKIKGMKVVALSGKDGGKLAFLADVEMRVPHNGYADRIQEVHIKLIHILIDQLEQRLA
jgi:D-sedoheptulose 7-phosphate isomerase|tara:strand:+ start:1796 stop:2362 length:567 start_codon:yes stop_codon:yes gene_type:complete